MRFILTVLMGICLIGCSNYYFGKACDMKLQFACEYYSKLKIELGL